MILIADCGGTNVSWCLIDTDGIKVQFKTPGMNAMMLTHDEMVGRISAEVVPLLGNYAHTITNVHFYGAGCVSEQVCSSVADAINTNIPEAEVEVVSDLLATCRSLCGDNAGIVCILGTGSNSCVYDGKQIVANVSPLGFILGDEGGGAYLGKVLVGDVLKHQLPDDICQKFLAQYDLDTVKVVERVYRQPYPNKFLASLTPFLSENIDRPEIHALVLNAFNAFFRRNVCQYASVTDNRVVNFCGSIAYYFRDVLAEAAAANGYQLGIVAQSPMEGLVTYHSK